MSRAPFTVVSGPAIPLGLADLNTDVIIPSGFMKGLDREGLGAGAFAPLRHRPDGSPDPRSVLNQPRFERAPILIAGPNFGCGSSREHAVWALADRGIRVVIAPSFAEIFADNAVRNGLLTVVLGGGAVERLLVVARHGDLTVDLGEQTVSSALHDCFHFEVDPFARSQLLNGGDLIDDTLAREDEISAYESALVGDRATLGRLS